MPERDYERLIKELDAARVRILPGHYIHIPSQNTYMFEKLVLDKETEGVWITYHDERLPQVTWKTTLEDWESKIIHEGETVQKYQWLSGEIGKSALSNF